MGPQAIIQLVFKFILAFFKLSPWAFFGLSKPKEFSTTKNISTIEIDSNGDIKESYIADTLSSEPLVVVKNVDGTYTDQNGRTITESDLTNTIQTNGAIERTENLYIRKVGYVYNDTFLFYESYKQRELTFGDIGVAQPDRDLFAVETKKLIRGE